MTISKAKRTFGFYKIREYCENKIPEEIRDKLKLNYEINGNRITINEERPKYTHDGTWVKHSVARIRYNQDKENWTLYWSDRNSKWHEYKEIKPSNTIDEIIKEIESDPTHIFWG